jgi:hypothetical protein
MAVNHSLHPKLPSSRYILGTLLNPVVWRTGRRSRSSSGSAAPEDQQLCWEAEEQRLLGEHMSEAIQTTAHAANKRKFVEKYFF